MRFNKSEALPLRADKSVMGTIHRPLQGVEELLECLGGKPAASFMFSTTKTRAKYLNLKRDPSISLIVDDLGMHKYVVAYGRAEIIEENVGELTRPIIQKYVPPDRVEQSVKAIGDDPARVLVVLRPEKIVTS